jgi:hypothetical protein
VIKRTQPRTTTTHLSRKEAHRARGHAHKTVFDARSGAHRAHDLRQRRQILTPTHVGDYLRVNHLGKFPK